MNDKGDILSIQCKMSLRGPNSMTKVNYLNIIMIYLYVPGFTPRLSITDTSLQLSERERITLELAVYGQIVSLGAEHLETHGQNFFSIEHLRS
jgi:hypothetical protein